MITIQNLQKRYGERVALKGIDLEVSKGELFAYLGPNGAGKSTTIRILTGLTRMSCGSAELAGFDIKRDAMQAKLQCGVVHQYVNLDQELTVFENLDLHGQLFSMGKKQRREKIATLLDYVEMSDRAETLIKNLS